jgi:hypothetical protein
MMGDVMAELELVGLHEDGEHLVLAAADGQRYRLHIDEPLRAAVRRDRPQLEQIRAEQSGVPSPREIQARVRAGQTAEQIAEASGLTVEHVRRFEGPVVAEREFLAEQARQTRIGRDVGAPVLGDLVLDRLAARGVDTTTLTWDAFREQGAGWTVVARYQVQDEPREARWGYDPSVRAVHADEDEARWLSETEIADGPLPRRHLTAVRDVVYDIDAEGSVRPVLAAVDSPAPAPEPEEEDPQAATQDLLDDLRARRGVRQTLDLEVPGRGRSGEQDEREHGGATVHAIGGTPAAAEPESAATPAEPEAEEPTTRTAAERPRGRRGRAKVPSWDEIVFGAKPE